jgi:hypothetical protein
MAAVGIHVDPKKKPPHNADRLPRDGLPQDSLTGMGLVTKRHFIKVRQKMVDYVGQQAPEYDDGYPHPHHHHHHHHHSHLIFVDGKQPSKLASQPHTPVSSRKQTAHLGVPTSHAVRRGGGKSPAPHAK